LVCDLNLKGSRQGGDSRESERRWKGKPMSNANLSQLSGLNSNPILSFLNQHQVKMIDEALSALGDYGELRLVVEKGRLRFIVTQKSFDALKWQPGTLDE
jgi:hypothetical protein